VFGMPIASVVECDESSREELRRSDPGLFGFSDSDLELQSTYFGGCGQLFQVWMQKLIVQDLDNLDICVVDLAEGHVDGCIQVR
jgi:hypothetical protein